MTEYIILQNPVKIDNETSIKINDYYLVYKFNFDKNTKCFYKNCLIKPEDCLDKINYDGIECRLYNTDVKKTNDVFKNNNNAFNLSLISFIFVSSYAFLFGKNN